MLLSSSGLIASSSDIRLFICGSGDVVPGSSEVLVSDGEGLGNPISGTADVGYGWRIEFPVTATSGAG